MVDNDPEANVVVTGSQNFGLLESITQSLAGRVGLLTLLPLSIAELGGVGLRPGRFEDAALAGGYPRIYERSIPPGVFYANYFGTYIERDVRLLKNIGDLSTFQRFVRLCAGRVGQLLNLSTLAADVGIAVNTAKSWLSVLEAGYVVTLLTPYHRNFNKRLTKSPKLYFVDTGLACWLLGIETAEQLSRHHARGSLFENLVISEVLKARFNRGRSGGIYFWRDHRGVEVDCLIEHGERIRAVEIKSSATITSDLLRGIERWRALAGEGEIDLTLVYAGDETQSRGEIEIIPWWDAGRLSEGGEQ
jgi:predicted AAA+ superfamily ATPase